MVELLEHNITYINTYSIYKYNKRRHFYNSKTQNSEYLTKEL